jgi:hypothetical protein
VELVKNIALVRHRLIGNTHNRGASPAPVDLGCFDGLAKNRKELGAYWPGRHSNKADVLPWLMFQLDQGYT